MSRAAITIEMLRRGARAADAAEWKRMEARTAWVKETAAAWREAQRAMDDRCTEAAGWMDEAALHRLCEAEQAKVDAIRAPLQAAADDDKWPRGLYWSL
jgi:hypothetical protein